MGNNASPGVEEYLEALCRLKEKGKKLTTGNVSELMDVSAPSVSEMFKKLNEKKLIKYKPHKGVELTKKGGEIGSSVLRKHRLIEKFLRILGLKKAKIHDEACKLEHVVSDELEEKLRSAIYDSGGEGFRKQDVKRLTELGKGKKARIAFIAGGVGATQRLVDMGLTPGTDVELQHASRMGGPVRICIRKTCLALGRHLAEKIFVEEYNERA